MGTASVRAATERFVTWTLAAFFLACSAFYLATTLCALANFAWRQPMFDQWRMYEDYLGLPFPQNILQPVNGHRPIIPNLVRIAEIQWLGGNQLLQIGVGTTCLLATWGALVFLIWRQRDDSVVARAAETALVTLGLFWLGNARMLAHGNESLHVYMLTLMVVCAAWLTYRTQALQSRACLALATLCCVIATFCFGPGVASFPAIIVLGVVLRLPWRWLLIPAAVLAACLLLYLFLPGNEGVRGMIAVDHPVNTLETMARWSSSPWINGWLGFADPPLYPWMVTTPPDQAIAHVLHQTANFILAITGTDWRDLGVWIGASGILLCAVHAGSAMWSRHHPDRLQVVMLGVCLFALAAAGVIGLGRLGYFRENPEQVFADRYLVWPSLFWMSLAVLSLRSIRHWHPTAHASAYLSCLLLPIMLLPVQSANTIWLCLVYRGAQANAAALESGVYDEAHFPGAGIGRPETLEEIGLFRKNQVAMFADGAWQHVGSRWTGALQPSADVSAEAHWLPPITDSLSNKPAGHLEGWATHGVARLQRKGRLAILTNDGTIAGLAEWSFVPSSTPMPTLRVPRKRGFDGYVHDYDPSKEYILAWLDFVDNRGVVLSTLAPQTSVQTP